MSLSVQMRRPFVIVNDDAGIINRGIELLAQVETAAASTEAASGFATRAALVSAIAGGLAPIAGATYRAAGVEYLGQSGATSIPDMPGIVPNGVATPQHFGAFGDGVANDRPAFAAANTAGTPLYITKPAVSYTFPSPLAMTIPVMVDPSSTWDQITDNGALTWANNMGGWTNVGVINTRRVNIHRFSDRVFVGGAAQDFAGNSASADGGSSWWSNPANGASYLGVNANHLTIAKHAPYGTVALARGSDVNGGNPIGLGASVVNDVAGKNAWGGILELQHEAGAGLTLGLEIGAKYKGGAFTTLNAYNNGAGVVGLWCAGGGDANFGGGATLPANSPIVILKNGASGLAGGGWATGIVFRADAIDGADGTSGSAGIATAVSMARGHALAWGAPTVGALPTGSFGARVVSRVNDAANAVQMFFQDSQITLTDRSGNVFSAFVDGGGDYVTIRSSTSGARVDASGPGSNVNLRLVPKGTGLVNVDSGNINLASGVVQIASAQVVSARKTGWTVATGTASRATFDTSTVTLSQLAERVKALIDDLHASSGGHGLIGA